MSARTCPPAASVLTTPPPGVRVSAAGLWLVPDTDCSPLLTLPAAAAAIAAAGRKPHAAGTLWRWMAHGLVRFGRRVKLEVRFVGSQPRTTRAALVRWTARCSGAEADADDVDDVDDVEADEADHDAKPPTPTRSHQAAMNRLAARGLLTWQASSP